MTTPSVVVPERTFRALSGKCAGQVFEESDVCICDEQLGGCEGRGVIQVPGLGEVVCPQCDGVGMVLGYPDCGLPVRLEVVEEAARAAA
jgi:hypothetical protein